MPTNRELQDEADELRLALEEAREAESELAAARNEMSGLRAELSQSESQRCQLQSTLGTLNETQLTLADLYEEKEQRLLARLAAEAGLMAEAGVRWAAQEATLRGELEERGSAAAALETRISSQRKQLSKQAGWVDMLRRERNAALEESGLKDLQISSLDTRLSRTGEQLRQMGESGNPSRLAEGLELLIARPGCWAAVMFLVVILSGIVYVISSVLAWLKPSESLLGR